MRSFNSEFGEVKYSTFKVDAPYETYTLHVDGFSTSGDPWREFSYLYIHVWKSYIIDAFRTKCRAQDHIQ